MSNGHFHLPAAKNEHIFSYSPSDPARETLQNQIRTFRNEEIEIPLIIGGKEIRTGKFIDAIEPHARNRRLAKVHQAREKEVQLALSAAAQAKKSWENFSWEDRAAVFLRAADMLAGKYRPILNAATMLNQSKTCHQAEIDSACELIDFFHFNVQYMSQIYAQQPESSPGIWNRMEYRALEGFVFAVSPFNFTAIAGNLSASPAMMGNTILWKPSATALFSGYQIMKLLEEAGLPPGVVNFIPGPSSAIAPTVLKSPDLGGVHFTGSTAVFNQIWSTVGQNISHYRSYPRLVGETGGKDFVFVHQASDPKEVATALVRGAFEYQGQKCSAASRAYVAKSLWPAIEKEMLAQLSEIKMGDVTDFRNFVGAVIDEKSFDNIMSFVQRAAKDSTCKIVAGGRGDKSQGFFIEPTVILTTDPKQETMCQELFGPVLSVFLFDDQRWEEALTTCDQGSAYGLTGAFFSREREAIAIATQKLRHSAGNFYINDKPTGAVVGQQPFGGARGSGTNDKAGSYLNLVRWTSPRTIKETFCPPSNYRYPFLG